LIPFLVAAGCFVCVMAGALVGLWLGQRVPEHCRTEQSREAIQVAAGMISFLAALVLGLLTASVQNSFDSANSQVNGFAAQLAMLDQTLTDMGPEATAARGILRHYTALSLQDNWPEENGAPGPTGPSIAPRSGAWSSRSSAYRIRYGSKEATPISSSISSAWP